MVEVIDFEGKRQGTFDPSVGRITDLEFSPGGRFLAVSGGLAGSAGGIALLSWPQSDVLSGTMSFKDQATAVAWHPAGALIAVSSADQSVGVHAVMGGTIATNPVYRMVNHSRAVLDLGFDPEGELLVTASADRSLKVWEASSGKLLRSLANHTEIVNSVAMRPRTRFGDQLLPSYCASGGDDKTVRIWQPGIGRMVRIVRYHEAEVLAVLWHPDGTRLFSADRAGVVRIIDGDSDQVLVRWNAHSDWIYALAIDAKGDRLATADWKGAIKLWDLTRKRPELLLEQFAD